MREYDNMENLCSPCKAGSSRKMEPCHCLCDLVQPLVTSGYCTPVYSWGISCTVQQNLNKSYSWAYRSHPQKGLFLWTLCQCMFRKETCILYDPNLTGKPTTKKGKFLGPPPLVQLPTQDQVQLVEARLSTQHNLPAKLCHYCKKV